MFEKFLKTIRAIFPSDPQDVARFEEALTKLNPDKIYVENVRSLLDISHERASKLCEIAVRQGVFERRVEVLCPDGTVAASASSESLLPVTVQCWVEEDGHYEQNEHSTAVLQKMIYYRLFSDDKATAKHRTA